MFVKLCLFWLFLHGKETVEKYLTTVRAGGVTDDPDLDFLLSVISVS